MLVFPCQFIWLSEVTLEQNFTPNWQQNSLTTCYNDRYGSNTYLEQITATITELFHAVYDHGNNGDVNTLGTTLPSLF